jgi:hypothetical protein
MLRRLTIGSLVSHGINAPALAVASFAVLFAALAYDGVHLMLPKPKRDLLMAAVLS